MANFLVHVGHPAHVHFFKYAIKKLTDSGNNVYVTAVDKEFTITLLEEYGISYEIVGVHRRGILPKFISMLRYDRRFVDIIKKRKIDVAAAVGSPSIAQAGYFTKIPSVIFTDTEAATIGNKFMAPFAETIATPECFRGEFGVRHLRYAGYQELSYLHPKYFVLDESVLADNGLSVGEKFIVLRFVSRVSLHDRGDVGLSREASYVVRKLGSYGRILVSSERPLSGGLSESIIKEPSKIHSLLYYASLYIGESPTMASEAAMLGTPAIYAQGSFRGYTEEEEKKYGLVYNFHNPKDFRGKAIDKACEILENDNSKREWGFKRDKMLSEKIDVTEFIVNTLMSKIT